MSPLACVTTNFSRASQQRKWKKAGRVGFHPVLFIISQLAEGQRQTQVFSGLSVHSSKSLKW